MHCNDDHRAPVDAFWEKNGSIWMLIESIASSTSCAPPRSWYPYASSDTVIGMLRLLSSLLASIICCVRSSGDRTLSKSGSEPN
jgi:hypothetical protein